MRIVNFMNFVRQCDPRLENSEEILFETTKQELAIAKEYGIQNTFLLQYDALIDERYINLFQKEADETTELGLWFEIPKPLLDKAGLPWRGRDGWTWDWHIVPGFSMAYTQEERRLLIDTAMNDFKEIFGFYPKTVASWLIDSYSITYLTEKYAISALGICRDQTATDAYTLVGGYFNQAYYPSKINMFTPAQTDEYRINVPIFRLLGPDPIHNSDKAKYIFDTKNIEKSTCYTMEPVWKCGSTPEIVKWFFRNYFENEDLGFSYAQIGQENSFGPTLLAPLKMQLEELKAFPNVKIMKMCDTGKWFKKQFPNKTPATSVSGLDDWATNNEVQSIYYDCQNYMANIIRYGNKISIRYLYLFNEQIAEDYLNTPCNTWNASYQNLPVIDTILWKENEKDNEGLILDEHGSPFTIKKIDNQVLAVTWAEKSVIFSENEIRIYHLNNLVYDFTGNTTKIHLEENTINFNYKNTNYKVTIYGAKLSQTESGCMIEAIDNKIRIRFCN